MRQPKVKLDDSIGFAQLYRYATWFEKACVYVAVAMALAASLMMMGAIVVYGELTNLFVERTRQNGTYATAFMLEMFGGAEVVTNGTREDYMDALVRDSYAFGYCSLAIMLVQFAGGSAAVYIMNWVAQRQINRIRYRFLESVLRQDMSWFDTETNLNFASKISDDLEKLKDGIGEKVAMFAYLVGSILIGCALSFAYGWQLTLVGLTVIPLSIAVATVVSKIQTKSSDEELTAYGKAGRVVEEVLSGIRTVIAFAGEEKELKRYAERLRPAELCGRRRGLITGVGAGLSWFLTYALNAIVFLYGTKLIVDGMRGEATGQVYYPGTMVTIIFSIYMAAQNISMCSPHTETFAAAKGAAQSIWRLIERKPRIDSLHQGGATPRSFQGDILLENVHFAYPSRPGVKVLKGLTLKIKAGETVALVGSSGCGKSTVLQLTQRLYDPDAGSVRIDGMTVAELNLGHLRRSIGVVGQEPVLFSGTIRDNIALGKEGATFEEVTSAAKKAYAHDFIQNMADGYNTIIGEKGAQLSGGQKQRIAIARSLIRNPGILLLDEATSALDVRSERKVQAALDAASVGRTTLVVSHRLSTIVNATRIVFLDQGVVAEEGNHQELLAKRGLYWKLVQTDIENRASMPPVVEEVTSDESPESVDTERPHGISPLERNAMIRESRRELNASLRRANRRTSVASVKTVGIPQIIPDQYDDVPDEEEVTSEVTNWQLLKLNASEWPWILVGCISSVVVGATMPMFAVLFSYVYGMFQETDLDLITASSQLYSGLFIGVAVLAGLATFLQAYVFSRAGLKLTTRLRQQAFASYLRQEMGWYDDPQNSVGALCARLSSDAAAVQGATGTRVGTILQGIATMVIGVIVAMAYSWKMALVSMLSIPVVIGAIYLEGIVMKVSQRKEKKAMEVASKIATEAIMNVRTVQSMGIEPKILERYNAALREASTAGRLVTRLRGAVYALGLCAPTLGYAVSLVYGGVLIAKEDMPYRYAILVSEALIYGSWMLGQALSFAPNFSSAKNSGARILAMINRTPAIVSEETAKDDEQWKAQGDIDFNSISFRYPTRRNVSVLHRLSLRLRAGSTVALVGHSGCGKSTCLQLLQRLYDPDEGAVSLDGKDIKKDLSIPRLRSQLGIVQQEPVLFDKTIAENIAYGDNSREVCMDEVVAAAQAANVHSFIAGLPQGYETALGSKGAQLSGGQKQRIAIARALIRNPRVLLLDEATSALDTQSEKVVQAALDDASKGRTCIIIAHRLSTVQNADTICVLDKGIVVETGRHSELIAKKGLYYDLHSMQNTA